MDRRQYTMLDVGKFLCALLILFYHFFSEIGSLPWLLEEALSSYAIAVALFMTISGFLTFSKLETVPDRAGRWQLVRRQAWRIIRIYLLWSVVYILYTISTWEAGEISVRFLLQRMHQWIFCSTFYTIWFMPALAVGLIVAFWISELLPEYAGIGLAIVLYALGALTLTYAGVGAMIPGHSQFAEFANAWLGGARGWLFYGTPLLLVGRGMAKYKTRERAEKPLIWLLLSMAAMLLLLIEALVLRNIFGATGVDMTVMMPIVVFCVLGFLLCCQVPRGKWLLWMRQMSLLIFITQRIFLTVVPGMFPVFVGQYLFSSNWAAFVFCVGGTIAFSAAIIALSKKIKPLRLLY